MMCEDSSSALLRLQCLRRKINPAPKSIAKKLVTESLLPLVMKDTIMAP